MRFEPAARQIDDLVERAGLLEKVRRARDDFEPLLTGEPLQRLLVELDHPVIGASHY